MAQGEAVKGGCETKKKEKEEGKEKAKGIQNDRGGGGENRKGRRRNGRCGVFL